MISFKQYATQDSDMITEAEVADALDAINTLIDKAHTKKNKKALETLYKELDELLKKI